MANREIKFRGWHRGVPDYKNGKPYPPTMLYEENQGEVLQWARYQPIDIMQYTGLKDKNGKEIYEGDIIKVDDTDELIYECRNVVAPIIFERGAFRFECFKGFQKVLDESCDDCIVVIGNIYENPDLLEAKDE